MKTWLKTYSDPKFVDNYWEKTYNLRSKEFKSKKKYEDLFLEWPKFSSTLGPEFIRKDFYVNNMQNFNKLIDNFESFSRNILEFAFKKSNEKIEMFNPSRITNLSKRTNILFLIYFFILFILFFY